VTIKQTFGSIDEVVTTGQDLIEINRTRDDVIIKTRSRSGSSKLIYQLKNGLLNSLKEDYL
jgi:hypothetical protein